MCLCIPHSTMYATAALKAQLDNLHAAELAMKMEHTQLQQELTQWAHRLCPSTAM